HRLDLHAADVLAGVDDHVLGTVADLKVTIRMHHADVPRVEPPVLAYRRLGRRVVVEIAEHDAAAAEHDLAHRGTVAGHAAAGFAVHDVDFARGRRAHALPRLKPCALRRGEAVPLTLPGAGHRQPCGLGYADVHLSRERPSHALGGVGQHVKHHGRAAEMGDPTARDGGVHRGGVDAAEADIGAAHHGHPPRVTPAVGVEHGQRPQVRRPRRNRPFNERVDCDQEGPAVAVHHPLGLRRRAGGVVDHHRVPLALRLHPHKLRVALVEKPLPERVADELQRRWVDEDELGAGVVEQDGDRACVQARVDVVEHGAAHGHSELHLVHGRH
ncbi:hypothetical protein ACJX0J_036809, partial [Zea mays]